MTRRHALGPARVPHRGMIVYADRRVRKNTLDFFAEIRSLSGIDLLIAFGQFESGVVDASSPSEDRYDAPVRALRYAATSSARSWMGVGRPVLGPIRALNLPEEIEVVKPAGYAYHALYPEQYAEAAGRFLREVHPVRSVVIGIRDIGTSLSAVVAAAVDAAMSVTMRSRGGVVKLSRELAERLRWQRDAHFLIVGDPGDGEAFVAISEALRTIGVPENRVVLFPGVPGTNYGCFDASFESVILPQFGAPRDLSAGRWRQLFWKDQSQFPAVQPLEERRKYLRDGLLLKFVGLGFLGREKLTRARFLANAGFTPEAVGFDNGFLCTRWEEGAPLQPGFVTLDLIRRIAAYLVLVAREYHAEGRIRYDQLLHMVESNAGAMLPRWDRALIEDSSLVAIDGHMLPHEWIRTPNGFLKTDAVDHHDDLFFPGCQDIAWDIAGAVVEFGIPREALVAEYLAHLSDRTLTRRLPFYMRAYLAYRLGFASIAAEALAGQPDAARFTLLAGRYSSLLRQLLA
jgi:hypothetical protein